MAIELSAIDVNRAAEMLEIAAEYIDEYWPEGTAEYDGTTCDGGCIAEDCRLAAEALRYG